MRKLAIRTQSIFTLKVLSRTSQFLSSKSVSAAVPRFKSVAPGLYPALPIATQPQRHHYNSRRKLHKVPSSFKPVPVESLRNRVYSTIQNYEMSGHSASCCSIPPIVGHGYEAKGKYEKIGGMKTYVTGPSDGSTAILVIFDVFGYFPQTLQGSDILATSDDDHKYQIFMPDFFDGKPADISWYPPNTKEKGEHLGKFLTANPPPSSAAKILPYIADVSKKYPNIKTWGAVGYCWGGKVVSMTSTSGTPFSAAAECHPSMIDPADAEKVTIPLCILASKDENAKDIEAFERNLKGEKHVETFGDQIHGWMAARADLSDEREKAGYERGYKTLLEFFAKHL